MTLVLAGPIVLAVGVTALFVAAELIGFQPIGPRNLSATEPAWGVPIDDAERARLFCRASARGATDVAAMLKGDRDLPACDTLPNPRRSAEPDMTEPQP